jgi:hypothetical protein
VQLDSCYALKRKVLSYFPHVFLKISGSKDAADLTTDAGGINVRPTGAAMLGEVDK